MYSGLYERRPDTPFIFTNGQERKYNMAEQSLKEKTAKGLFWGGFSKANEPDIAYAHLFSYFRGEEWRTQKETQRLLDKYFTTKPNGIPGNDDTGTMSAWAIFNMIGFYPDCPGLPEYTLTTPVFNKVTIRLDPKWYKEKELVIESNRTQPGTLYINKVLLNGKKFNQYRITHDELVHSQRILFDLK